MIGREDLHLNPPFLATNLATDEAEISYKELTGCDDRWLFNHHRNSEVFLIDQKIESSNEMRLTLSREEAE